MERRNIRKKAEYFSFESGQGYCQHFAVAAVLLYRLYGIPARYAAGYAVQPSDFQRQEDGNWTAESGSRLKQGKVEMREKRKQATA